MPAQRTSANLRAQIQVRWLDPHSCCLGGQLPEEHQAHLLRVLDTGGEYHRLGESELQRSDFRLVAATNRGLERLKHDFVARPSKPRSRRISRRLPAPPSALSEEAEEAERAAAALERAGGNVSRAAAELGISRYTMYRLMRKHGLPG